MELYTYQGRNERGELLSGTIEAPNTDGVVHWMKSSGMSPIHIQLKNDPLKDQPTWLRALQGAKKLSPNDLLMFTRQMSTFMRAGVPMIQAVNGLKNNSKNPAMTQLLRSLHATLNKGSELSAAMAKAPDFFDDYYVNMVRVGESTGKLDEIFDRLYAQLDFDRRMRQKIKSVVRYPMFVLGAIVVAILIMTIYVIPVFSRVYSNMNMTLPPLTVALLSTSSFIRTYWMPLALALAAAVLGLRTYFSSPQGRYTWDRRKLQIPLVGPVLQKATTARFCRSFGIAMKSGVPIVSALTLVGHVVDNAYYKQRIGWMRDAVSKGDSLIDSFMLAGVFSPAELQMISVGEETGDVEAMVAQLAMLYQEEVEYEANQLAETLEPVLLVFMALLVTLLLLGVFLPMWNMTQMIR
jgi:MSHA biogenesis protein MshG